MREPNNTIYLPISKAAKFLGVHVDTLRRWAQDGFVEVARHTRGGHRRFAVEELERLAAALNEGVSAKEWSDTLGRLTQPPTVGRAHADEVWANQPSAGPEEAEAIHNRWADE